MVEFRDEYLVSTDGEKFRFTDTSDISKCIKEATKAICGFLGKGYEDNGLGLKKEEWELRDNGSDENEPEVKKCRNFEHSQMKKYLFILGEEVAKSYTDNSMRLQSKLINSLIANREDINK